MEIGRIRSMFDWLGWLGKAVRFDELLEEGILSYCLLEANLNIGSKIYEIGKVIMKERCSDGQW